MKLVDIINLEEARGSGSFDYKYWFWAKRGTTFGMGYARQPIELDIAKAGVEAKDAIQNIKDVVDSLEKKGESQKSLEIVEKKIKANTKRIKGIIDLFGSPIIVFWLNKEKPTPITLPIRRKGDVTVGGKDIDVIRLFRDADTTDLALKTDWSRVTINDKEGDTHNTVMTKFISSVFGKGADKKTLRTAARSSGVEDIMSELKFKDETVGVEVVPFQPKDYNLFPKEIQGSKKMVEYMSTLLDKNFAKVLKTAREAF